MEAWTTSPNCMRRPIYVCNSVILHAHILVLYADLSCYRLPKDWASNHTGSIGEVFGAGDFDPRRTSRRRDRRLRAVGRIRAGTAPRRSDAGRAFRRVAHAGARSAAAIVVDRPDRIQAAARRDRRQRDLGAARDAVRRDGRDRGGLRAAGGDEHDADRAPSPAEPARVDGGAGAARRPRRLRRRQRRLPHLRLFRRAQRDPRRFRQRACGGGWRRSAARSSAPRGGWRARTPSMAPSSRRSSPATPPPPTPRCSTT